jgi:hypothetical protein
MDRDGLVALVESYAHRSDASVDNNIAQFIEFATKRIGRDLRSQFNTVTRDPVVGTENPIPLGEDFREMRIASYPLDGGGNVDLKAVPVHLLERVTRSGQTPRVYTVVGTDMILKPFQVKVITITAWVEPAALATGTAENDVLTNYPYVYLYATLIELWMWTQDPGLRDAALSDYNAETVLINEQSAASDLGDAPAMVRV